MTADLPQIGQKLRDPLSGREGSHQGENIEEAQGQKEPPETLALFDSP
jgi:hypothetical protein